MIARTLALVLLAATALPADDAPHPPSQSTERGILFVSNRDGIEDIYVMDADGSNVRRLTHTEGEERVTSVPAWSPDGTEVVFASNRDDGGSANLYVVAADGSNLRRLTRHGKFDYVPDWSPDGARIAFMSNRDGPPEVYVMSTDGSNVERLTFLEKGSGQLCCPDWSPDATQIAFHAAGERAGISVYVMDANGANLRELGLGSLPRWSPDGNQIAFVEAFQIHLMNADGSERRKLSAVEGLAVYPVWSPDGSRIAFTFLPRGGDFEGGEIYVMNLDGSDLTNLTSDQTYDGHANWW
jgi:TolB protein